MAKTKEELENLKKEYESLTSKLNELTEEELKEVTGGNVNHHSNKEDELFIPPSTVTLN